MRPSTKASSRICVYMLRCHDGRYYVGSTRDGLERRVAEHNSGALGGFTAARRPVSLVWHQEFERVTDAIAVERKIKGWTRAKKEALIAGDFGRLSDVARRKSPFAPPSFETAAARPPQDEGGVEGRMQPLHGPFAWRGVDLVRDGSWIMPWTAAELAEIDRAVAHAKRRGIAWKDVRKEDFPLPGIEAKLARIAEELENGRGVAKLTGLPIERYADADQRLLWMGFARNLGTTRYQDCRGQLMRDIRDEGADVGQRHGQITNPSDGRAFISSSARTYSSGSLRWHTDRTDVVGLLTVGQAKSGGISKIASSVAVHNAMVERRPDLAALLYKPIWRSRLGEEQGGETAIYPLPVFGVRDGKFTSHYSRTYVEAAQMLPAAPRMSDAQWEALDLLAALCDELGYDMRLARGDIQLINSHVTYHARTPFVDDPSTGEVRRLLRVWLCMPQRHRALPEDQAVLWVNVVPGALRGGITQAAA